AAAAMDAARGRRAERVPIPKTPARPQSSASGERTKCQSCCGRLASTMETRSLTPTLVRWPRPVCASSRRTAKQTPAVHKRHLIPQPGGFEGFVWVGEPLPTNHLAISTGVQLCVTLIHVQPALAPPPFP